MGSSCPASESASVPRAPWSGSPMSEEAARDGPVGSHTGPTCAESTASLSAAHALSEMASPKCTEAFWLHQSVLEISAYLRPKTALQNRKRGRHYREAGAAQSPTRTRPRTSGPPNPTNQADSSCRGPAARPPAPALKAVLEK